MLFKFESQIDASISTFEVHFCVQNLFLFGLTF